jgi:hypothetical protein
VVALVLVAGSVGVAQAGGNGKPSVWKVPTPRPLPDIAAITFDSTTDTQLVFSKELQQILRVGQDCGTTLVAGGESVSGLVSLTVDCSGDIFFVTAHAGREFVLSRISKSNGQIHEVLDSRHPVRVGSQQVMSRISPEQVVTSGSDLLIFDGQARRVWRVELSSKGEAHFSPLAGGGIDEPTWKGIAGSQVGFEPGHYHLFTMREGFGLISGDGRVFVGTRQGGGEFVVRNRSALPDGSLYHNAIEDADGSLILVRTRGGAYLDGAGSGVEIVRTVSHPDLPYRRLVSALKAYHPKLTEGGQVHMRPGSVDQMMGYSIPSPGYRRGDDFPNWVPSESVEISPLPGGGFTIADRKLSYLLIVHKNGQTDRRFENLLSETITGNRYSPRTLGVKRFLEVVASTGEGWSDQLWQLLAKRYELGADNESRGLLPVEMISDILARLKQRKGKSFSRRVFAKIALNAIERSERLQALEEKRRLKETNTSVEGVEGGATPA